MRSRQTRQPIKTEMYENLDDRLGSRRSAHVILPLVLELWPARSVVDLGCGVGSWLSVCQELGIQDTLGVDVAGLDRSLLRIPERQYVGHDLREPFRAQRSFDLALSLETAGYLDPDCADTFVTSLTQAAPVVLFSSSIPFQDASGIQPNQQWPDYWVRKFAAHNFTVIDCLRKRIWTDPRVQWWFAQNAMLFVHDELLAHDARAEALRKAHHQSDAPLPLVHPRMYEGRMPLHALLSDVRAAFKVAVNNRIVRVRSISSGGLSALRF